MQYYTEFVGMTPEELLLEAEKDIKDGVLPRQSKLKRHLLDFKEHLQSQDLAPLTIKNRMTGVYSFYKKNDITLPSLPNNETKPKPLLKHKDIPTKEDIQTVLRHADELERAIVLIGVSSGLGAQEISNLKVEDFKKGYDPVTGVTTLKLRREKVGYDFVTFLSPEASKAILDYLETRNKQPKVPTKPKLEQLTKQKVYSDDNYLLIPRRIPPEFLTTKDDKLRQLTEAAIIDIYQNLAVEAGKAAPHGTWSVIRSHNMRKYFNSTLLNNGANSFIVNFWMGHIQDDTKSAYYRASAENGLKGTYLKYVPFLAIQKEADVSESPEYLRIKNENSILQAETARHIVERHELQDLREKLELERADRYEYERNVSSMVDVLVQEKMKEFRQQMEAGFNETMERLKKNLKEPPIDLKGK
jgi:integrase